MTNLPNLPNLPTLTGEPDALVQIADGDRRAMLERLADQITRTAGDHPAELVAELVALYQEVALRHTDAGWWLSNNSYALGPILQREMTDSDRARIAAIRSRGN